MEDGGKGKCSLWHDLNISLPGVHSRGGLELGSTLSPGDTGKGQVAWEGLGRNQAEGLVTKRFGKWLQQWVRVKPEARDIHLTHECLQ